MISVDYPIPTIEDVRSAAQRIRGAAWRTPLVKSDWLSDLANADVWLKLEIVQTTGSFKIRGARNAIARVAVERPHVRKILTASAGNHGRAVALAASRASLTARVYVPATAPAAKKGAIARLGAEIVEMPTYDEAEAAARGEAGRGDTAFISAYNHPDVIAGAGTVALEMFEDQPDLDAIVAPIGGGGLISGTAIVARARGKDTIVVGAEVEASPVFTTALAANRITVVDVGPTLADGLAGNMEPDSRTFEFVRALVDRVVVVGESALEQAMRELVGREQLVVEGAGATGVAAVLQNDLIDLRNRRVGVILSGRNVDAHVVARLLGAGG
jgi:threonine dehydratase